MEKPLNCTIKNPVNLMLGDVKVDMLCGCKVIDITFPNIMSPEVILCFIIHVLCIICVTVLVLHSLICILLVLNCVENFTASAEL